MRSRAIPPRVVGRKLDLYPGLSKMGAAITRKVGNVQTPQVRLGSKRSAASVARKGRLNAAWREMKEQA